MNAQFLGNREGPVGRLLAVLPALALSGCVTVEDPPRSHWAPPPPAPSKGLDTGASEVPPSDLSAVTDLTVNHLNDLGGSLLLYYATHGQQLPQRLDEVEAIAGKPADIDPATGKLFLYRPDAPKIAGLPGFLVVCQAAPTKGASRWTLFINDQATNGVLVTGVRLVSDAVLGPVLAPAPQTAPPPTTAPAAR